MPRAEYTYERGFTMTRWECTECSSNNAMPEDFGCDDCNSTGAMKGREYICGDHLVPVRECGCKI